MKTYSSLKLVKELPFGWTYYPNNSSTGFTISKGYFTGDETTSLFQIVEDGKSKRPPVLLGNITVEDLVNGGGILSFATFAALTDKLVNLGCPLAVAQSSSSGGISTVVTDGLTIIGNGTSASPLIATGISTDKHTFSFTTMLSNGKTLGKYPTGTLVEVVDKTIPEIFEQIGVEVINPDIVTYPPTFSISLPNYTQREVGSTYSELMTATFNRGQIKGKLVAGVWQENTQQDFRAGVASTYTLDGSLQVGNTKTVSKVLDSGDNVFSGSVNFLTGVQPTNSAGENFDSPYAPGTLSDSKIIRAAYPVFYGTLNIGQTILDINLSAFTKVTNINPNNTVSIPYSNVLGKQLVILIPIENTIKTKWYVTESNKGGIDGITGDLFALPVTASYDSPTLLWLGKSYRVYISTPTSINTTIELRN